MSVLAANRAHYALDAYREVAESPGLSQEEAATDLLADLLHLISINPTDFDAAIDTDPFDVLAFLVRRASMHFNAEYATDGAV